jgi:hypothetical protein
MMQYRVVLTDPKGAKDRPQQILCNNMEQCYSWMEKVLAPASDLAFVTVYATYEIPIHTWNRTNLPGVIPAVKEGDKK